MSPLTMNVLAQALDVSALRQKTIANNIANVSTPGYKAKHVVFEDLLQKSLHNHSSAFVGRRTNPKHLFIGHPSGDGLPAIQIKQSNTVMGNNENNVDIDYEMSLLAKNQLKYYTLSQQMSHQFSLLRLGVTGRR